MNDKYKKGIVVSVIVLALGVAFTFSYRWAANKMKNENNNSDKKQVNNAQNSVVVQARNEQRVVKKNSTINLITNYKKNNYQYNEKKAGNDYEGKTKEQLEEIFKDYKVTDMNDAEITMVREVDSAKYNPDKYVVGEKDGFIAIYKSNSKGELAVDEVLERKVIGEENIKKLREQNFDLQFDTKEEAMDATSEYR